MGRRNLEGFHKNVYIFLGEMRNLEIGGCQYEFSKLKTGITTKLEKENCRGEFGNLGQRDEKHAEGFCSPHFVPNFFPFVLINTITAA